MMEACPEGHCTEAIATPEVFAKDPEFVQALLDSSIQLQALQI